jgi:putative pyruvate formate lyase activating enzyme
MILLRPLIDIWLPDFKFGPGRCAIRLSRTPWYYETVANNIKTLYEWGEEMVIRHLVMPNHVECCTKSVLEWIAKNIPGTPVNVMDQYRPEAYADPSSPSFSPDAFDIARRPTREEILRAWRYAEELGLNYREITFEKKLSIRSVEGLLETLIEH